VRWNHPQRGIVSPVDFIPLAEETGLVLQLGEWVMRTAIAESKRLAQAGFPEVRIAVNLSAHQFRQQQIARIVQRMLTAAGATPSRLQLEITESVLMQNMEATETALRALSEMGIELSLDDFGTGYSSLSYLKRFPIDVLKIDRSFVRDIPGDADDAAIASAIISMAHSLDIKVIAEGVETLEQLQFLRQRSCDFVQGYYFSVPLPAEALVQTLRENPKLAPADPQKDAGLRTLLILDDDPDALSLLQHGLRAEGYRILSTTRVSEALELLARQDVGVILCDQRMPEMEGVEFMRLVRDMYPRSVRVLMSAYEDSEAMRQAINVGAVYKFVMKPWDSRELMLVLEDAFQHYAQSTAPR
jgi:EAL domain-containing protein (putative c-di-GMP-specific phosphodiesterase class I)/ActR/RegA family two-component response regulator